MTKTPDDEMGDENYVKQLAEAPRIRAERDPGAPDAIALAGVDQRCQFKFPTGDRCEGSALEEHEHWLSNGIAPGSPWVRLGSD